MKRWALALFVFFPILTPASSIGIWQHQGTLTTLTNSDTPQQPSVINESGCQILSSPCFKMWYNNGLNSGTKGICYAESSDGVTWSRYSGNPIITGQAFHKVFKNGSTYYLYSGANTFPPTSIAVRTSTDGITWTLQNSSALTTGSAGTWEAGSIAQLNVLTIQSGTWYGYYTGTQLTGPTTAQWAMGLATSTDGINWTKGGSNPVITANGPSNFTWVTVGSTYYGWSQIAISTIPGASHQLPGDIMRFSATNPSGPFTTTGIPTFYRTQASEGIGTAVGQVADPCIISVSGTLYLYFSQSPNGSTGSTYTIGLAKAPSTSFAQLVGSYEGLVNVPLPTTAGLAVQLNTLASDNFTRANANPMGGNWTPTSTNAGQGATGNQILSNKMAAGGTNTVRGASYYSALTWAADQWGQGTLSTLTTSGDAQGVSLRNNTSGTESFYTCNVSNNSGSTGIRIDKYTAGTFARLTGVSDLAYTVSTGAVTTCVAIGTTLTMYVNGDLIFDITDSSFSTGAVGADQYSNSSATESTISAWAAGNFGGGGQVGALLVGP